MRGGAHAERQDDDQRQRHGYVVVRQHGADGLDPGPLGGLQGDGEGEEETVGFFHGRHLWKDA